MLLTDKISIEMQFPVSAISEESYKECKAKLGKILRTEDS